MVLIILTVIFVVLVYMYLIKPHKYWEERGIPSVKPAPIFGNMPSNMFQKRSFPHMLEDIYNSYPNKRYVGLYQFSRPTLMIRDLNLIKKITVKEFDTFPDHMAFSSRTTDPLAKRNLFSIKNENGWRDLRSTISPTFTSSKMKSMFVLMEQCANQFTNYFQKQQKDTVTVEMKEVYSRFAIDVIGTTAFGVNCDSLNEPENRFYMTGKKLIAIPITRVLKFLGFALCPGLMEMLNITVFGKETGDFFKGLVSQTIRYREENHIIRPDMIHLLMEARKGQLKFETEDNVADSGFAVIEESELGKVQKKQKMELTDEDITAQVFLFFTAGFDTVSTTLSFATYELATNPETQEKLREEIDEVVEMCKGKITYEALLGMKYLDCVISETLRKWPAAVMTDRTCVKPYTIEPEEPSEKSIYLETGSVLWLPIFAIHRDPQYYANPDKFDPERFNEENKHNIKPFSYLPFGAGPRACIGSRFALLEAKLLIFKLFQNFEVVPVAKTQIPLQLSKRSFTFLPDSGIWLGYKSRTSST